jgi:hypothetical protein
MTHTPPFYFAITQSAVKNWSDVSDLLPSPYVVYPNCGMCDSELFGHVFKNHKPNPIIHVYEPANLFNCRHSKNRLFEFVFQYFESPKLILFFVVQWVFNSFSYYYVPVHPPWKALWGGTWWVQYISFTCIT